MNMKAPYDDTPGHHISSNTGRRNNLDTCPYGVSGGTAIGSSAHTPEKYTTDGVAAILP